MFFERPDPDEPYIIAEVGQNHQGNLEYAREYIRVFSSEGADAIKFQTRDNQSLFAPDAYEMEYHSENAFAPTYGAHREALELDPEWLPILIDDCRNHGVDFISTPFDEPSLQLLMNLGVDAFKIASFDLGNLPFVDIIGATKKPVVMSTGGGSTEQIFATVEILRSHKTEVAILHCVSEYPCEFNRLGLSRIQDLKSDFPECTIGSSDHFNGTLSGPVAYLLGARVFEKHVTLNRSWRGTDHSFALERDGFRRFVRDIKRVRFMLPPKDDGELGKEPVFEKLGKSLIARNDIAPGQTIRMSDLSSRIFRETFTPVRDSLRIIGRRSKRLISAGSPVHYDDLD